MVVTVDITACGLCLVLALFARLSFRHDSIVALQALLTALLVLVCWSWGCMQQDMGGMVSRPVRGTEQ